MKNELKNENEWYTAMWVGMAITSLINGAALKWPDVLWHPSPLGQLFVAILSFGIAIYYAVKK